VIQAAIFISIPKQVFEFLPHSFIKKGAAAVEVIAGIVPLIT
jgi:hypothetical protein